MRKFLSVLLIAGMLLLTSVPAFSAPPTYARYGLQTSDAIETSTSLVLAAGTWVYGWKILADAANANAALSNSATYDAATTSNIIDELGEATAWDEKTNMFPQPIFCDLGVSISMPTTVGVVFVYYGPQP